jgi:hypothetical protein
MIATVALELASAGFRPASTSAANFGEDVAFLKKHTNVIMLSDDHRRAQIAVVPAWQGRVMTSTASGDAGESFGWINRELIAAGELRAHINAFGGEDRFWLGPEGGQFGLYFPPGAAFDLEHWQTPAPIDSMPYELVQQTPTTAKFNAKFKLRNYHNAEFTIEVDRSVSLLPTNSVWQQLKVKPQSEVRQVGVETDNRITNRDTRAWEKATGLISIWIPGMFNPSADTTIVIPIAEGPEEKIGRRVTSDYFGAVPGSRLCVRDRAIYFKGDGLFRSKIGINPLRSRGVIGSYDAAGKTLTIVQFSQETGVTDYVNSLWQLQDNPYGGDAINSYNDGPPAAGAKPLGPFYELESSSPAAALKPGESARHIHRTVHLQGPELALDVIARGVLGVRLEEIKAALPPQE